MLELLDKDSPATGQADAGPNGKRRHDGSSYLRDTINVLVNLVDGSGQLLGAHARRAQGSQY